MDLDGKPVVTGLGLMYDITITVLKNLKNKGIHEIEAKNIVSSKKYNILFEVNKKETSIVFSRDKFFDSLVKHITRL